VAGLGAAARDIHLPAYAKIPDLRVVGGFDPTGAPAGFGAPVFDSVEEMLKTTQPDLLAVLAPPSAHAELVRLGLEHGCHIFCEKPFTPTLEEGAELVALAQRVGRHVVVNQEFRSMRQHLAAREVLGSAEFGELVFLEARQTFYIDEQTEAGWRGQETRRTCQEFGIHVLDLCRFFFGAEPETIFACMPRPGGGPDYLNLIQLRFPGDRAAQITLDRLCRGRHDYLDLRLDGTEGAVETHLGGGVELRGGLRGGSRRPFMDLDIAAGGRARLYRGNRFRTLARDPLDLFASATRRLLITALDAIAVGDKPPCDAEDNLRSLALVVAAYESDRLRLPLDMMWGAVPSWRPARGAAA
jgi:predicted dehydrogenase